MYWITLDSVMQMQVQAFGPGGGWSLNTRRHNRKLPTGQNQNRQNWWTEEPIKVLIPFKHLQLTLFVHLHFDFVSCAVVNWKVNTLFSV